MSLTENVVCAAGDCSLGIIIIIAHKLECLAVVVTGIFLLKTDIVFHIYV